MPIMARQRSVDAARFSMVPRNDVPRSAFDVQFGHKTTFNAGYLWPVYVDEVLPGDSFRVKLTAFARLSTPVVPVMDNLILETHFFYVPNRLLWDNWERFMGEQANPTDSTSFLIPQVSVPDGLLIPGTIYDTAGLTLNNNVGPLLVNALPFRAMHFIWNEWYRDQDLQVPYAFSRGDGPDAAGALASALPRGKRHDYFTSARPWPQKPINADTTGTLDGAYPYTPGGPFAFLQSTYGAGAPVSGLGVASGAAATLGAVGLAQSGSRVSTEDPHFASSEDTFYMASNNAGLSPDVRVMVSDLRQAIMIQGMLERNARGGTRYTELVRSHFGVISPDARLQRPEFLGGGRSQVTVNPVAQTSASGEVGTTTVLGELAGIGASVMTNHGFSQSFTEHGVIIGFLSVRSDLTYQQGNNRMWYRRTQFDFYWPALAHLGEQAILKREIFANGTNSDVEVFGYQERWSEYKYKPSMTSGFFRSTNPTPLDMWHYGELFGTVPVLNAAFIHDDPPVDRVLQVDTNFGEQFLCDMFFDVRMVRAMPMFSIPGVGPRL